MTGRIQLRKALWIRIHRHREVSFAHGHTDQEYSQSPGVMAPQCIASHVPQADILLSFYTLSTCVHTCHGAGYWGTIFKNQLSLSTM